MISGSLLSIGDDEEFQFVKDTLAPEVKYRFWIGEKQIVLFKMLLYLNDKKRALFLNFHLFKHTFF